MNIFNICNSVFNICEKKYIWWYKKLQWKKNNSRMVNKWHEVWKINYGNWRCDVTSHRWFMHSSRSWSQTKIYFPEREEEKKEKKKRMKEINKEWKNKKKKEKKEDWVERSRTYSLGKRNGGCNELVCSLLTNILFTNSEITRFLCSFAAWCTKIITQIP